MTTRRSLKVRGPFRGGSGYDYHTRSFVREFVRLGVAVELEELLGWSHPLPPVLQDPFFDALVAPVTSGTQLQFVMPSQLPAASNLAIANYTMFEATRVPPAWVDRAQECALTIVPARASLDAWVRSGAPAARMRICPLGVRPDLAADGVTPLLWNDAGGRPIASYGVRMLNIGETIPRKNQLGLVEAWLRATSPNDDAILLLKLNRHRDGLADLFAADLADVFTHVGKTRAECAPIHIVTDYLPDELMPRLYRTVTHYVSLSFGEGWDLPMTEAAAAGLTLIAPKHGPYLDYLDDRSAHLVPSVETPADWRRNRLGSVDASLFHGLNWAIPDGDAAADLIRQIIDGRAPVKQSPAGRIAADYSWENVSRQLLDVLAELP